MDISLDSYHGGYIRLVTSALVLNMLGKSYVPFQPRSRTSIYITSFLLILKAAKIPREKTDDRSEADGEELRLGLYGTK